tara:strand:- start:239 stop:535 length:297 start_codon:yes stop_codon:yes gene_type:complete
MYWMNQRQKRGHGRGRRNSHEELYSNVNAGRARRLRANNHLDAAKARAEEEAERGGRRTETNTKLRMDPSVLRAGCTKLINPPKSETTHKIGFRLLML